MFTGLVEDVGKVKSISVSPKGATLRVITSLDGIKMGDSVSVNGVCLTATSVEGGELSFELSPETLKRSNLGFLKAGSFVNLERALRLSDRLGGHILLGHVDFVSKIVSFKNLGKHYELKLFIPSEWLIYFVEKGSVGVDGISLTVNYIEGNLISINIIPHTYQNTNLRYRKEGDLVNIEADILGKYVVNYLKRAKGERWEKLLEEFLG